MSPCPGDKLELYLVPLEQIYYVSMPRRQTWVISCSPCNKYSMSPCPGDKLELSLVPLQQIQYVSMPRRQTWVISCSPGTNTVCLHAQETNLSYLLFPLNKYSMSPCPGDKLELSLVPLEQIQYVFMPRRQTWVISCSPATNTVCLHAQETNLSYLLFPWNKYSMSPCPGDKLELSLVPLEQIQYIPMPRRQTWVISCSPGTNTVCLHAQETNLSYLLFPWNKYSMSPCPGDKLELSLVPLEQIQYISMPRRQTWVISCSPWTNTVCLHAQETNLSYLLLPCPTNTVCLHAQETNLSYLLFPWNKYSIFPCPGDKLELSLVPWNKYSIFPCPGDKFELSLVPLEQIQYVSMPRRQTWVISCSPGTNTVCLHAQETNLSYLLFPWNKYSIFPCPGDKLELSLVPLEQIQYISMPRRQTWVISCSPGTNTVCLHAQETNLSYLLFPWNKYSMSPCPGDKLELSLVPLDQIQYVSMPRRQAWVISCSPGTNTVYFHAQETNLSYLLFPLNKYSMSPCPGNKRVISCSPGTNTVCLHAQETNLSYLLFPWNKYSMSPCPGDKLKLSLVPLEQIQYVSMPRRQTWVISCSPGTNTVYFHAQETNLSYLLFPLNKYSMSPCPGDKLELSLVPLEQIQYISMPRRQTWVISCSPWTNTVCLHAQERNELSLVPLEQIQYVSMPRRQTWVISCSPWTNTVYFHAQETNLSYLLFPWNKYSMSPCPGDKLKLSLVPLEQIQYVSMPRRQT